MEYLIIGIVIFAVIVAYIFFRIPTELHVLASNAGFIHYSLKYRKMKSQKVDVKFLYQQYVRTLGIGISVAFDDLLDYYNNSPEKLENMVSVLIRAKRAGVKISIEELEKFEISGGNIEQLVDALKIVQNANIEISRDVLESHSLYGGDIKTFVEIVLRAKKAKLELNLKDLVEENLKDDEMVKIVNNLIIAQKAGLFVTEKELEESKNKNKNSKIVDLRISQKGLLEHYRANIDIEKYVSAMVRAKKAGIEIDRDALNIHYLTDGDMEKLVNSMIKAERAQIGITQKELVEHNIEGRDIGRIVKNIIKGKQAELDISAAELIDFHRIGGNPEDLIKALIIAKKNLLDIGKKELEDHFLAGADVLEYVKAREIIKFNPGLGVNVDDINNHYLKGGNVLKTLFALMYAQKNMIEINANTAFKYDLVEAFDINDIINWAVNPQIIEVTPPPTVVAKDGVQVTLKIRATIRGKIALYIKGSKEEVLFGRINEAVSEEIPKYKTYSEVLTGLNNISNNVLNRLQGKLKTISQDFENKFEEEEEISKINEKEKDLNKSSAFEVLDIKVFDIIIGNDTLAEFKHRHALHEKEMAKIHLEERISKSEALEAEAKVRLINAKAILQEGMAEAYKNGNLDTNQYLKEKYIFDAYEDKENKHLGHAKKVHGPKKDSDKH